RLGDAATTIVLPHAFIEAVVEVEEFEILELRARRREQFLANPDMRVHRAADIEEHQHLHRVAALGPHHDVDIAFPGGLPDRAVEIEFFLGAVARPFAQAAQRYFYIARADLDIVVEILELALVPHFHRALVAAFLLADAHAFGIVAIGAEGRRAGRADPLVAALVAFLLFLHALLQRLHQLVPAAERFDLFLFL